MFAPLLYPSNLFSDLEVVNINGPINFTTNIHVNTLNTISISNNNLLITIPDSVSNQITGLMEPFINNNQAVNKEYVDNSFQFNPSGLNGSIQVSTSTSNIIWTSAVLYSPNIYTNTTSISETLSLGLNNPVNISGLLPTVGPTAGGLNLVLPTSQGLNNTVLQVTSIDNSNYYLNWVSNDAIVSGPLNSIQYNKLSHFTGSSDLTFASNILTCSGTINALTSVITQINTYEITIGNFSIIPSTNIISNYTLTFPANRPESTALFTNSGGGNLVFTTSTTSGLFPSDPLNSIQVVKVLATTSGSPSTVTLQDLTFSTVEYGSSDTISIEYIGGKLAGSETVQVYDTLNGKNIVVKMQSGVSTASNIKAVLDSSLEVSDLLITSISGSGSNTQTATNNFPLTGGGVGPSTLILQDLTYTSIDANGNDITVSYITADITAGNETVYVSVPDKNITVGIVDGVSTAQNIYDAINLSVDATALVTVTISGSASNTQTVTSFFQTSPSNPAIPSTVTIQDITYDSSTGNNNIAITYYGDPSVVAGAEVVVANPDSLVVYIADGTGAPPTFSTADDINNSIQPYLTYVDLGLTSYVSGTGTNVQTPQGPTNLSGGSPISYGFVDIQSLSYYANVIPDQFIINYIAGPSGSGVSVAFSSNIVDVTFENGVSTAIDIQNAVNTALYPTYINVLLIGPAGAQNVEGLNYLTGGASPDSITLYGVEYTANTFGPSGIILNFIDEMLDYSFLPTISVTTIGINKFITIGVENNITQSFDVVSAFNSNIHASSLATATYLLNAFTNVSGLSFVTGGGSPNKYYDTLIGYDNLLWNDGIYINNTIVSSTSGLVPRVTNSIIVSPSTISYLTSNGEYCFATGDNILSIIQTNVWGFFEENLVSTSTYSNIIKTLSINNYLYTLTSNTFFISNWKMASIDQSISPTTISTLLQNNLKDLFIVNNYTYLTHTNGLLICDLSNIIEPTTITNISFTSAGPIYVHNNYAYVGDSIGLWVVSSPSTIGYLSTTPIFALGFSNNYLYASTTNSLLEIDIFNPFSISILRTISVNSINKFIVVGYNAYCIVGSNELRGINLQNTSSINAVTISGINSLTMCGNKIYVCASNQFKTVDVFGNNFTSSYMENLNTSNIVSNNKITIEGYLTSNNITTNSFLTNSIVLSKVVEEISTYGPVTINSNSGKIILTDPDIILYDDYQEIFVTNNKCNKKSIIKGSINKFSSGFPTISIKDIENGSFTIVITNKSSDSIMSGLVEVIFVVF